MPISAMSYTTVSLMLQTLPMIGSLTTVTTDQLRTYAAQAESIINAKLAQKYTIPPAYPSPQLETIATDLAIYRVLALRVFTEERVNASVWPDRYKEAMADLDKIAAGELLLTTGSGTLIAGRTDTAEFFSTTQQYQPTFHEGPPTLTLVDPDKIEDELDKRDLSTITNRLT